MHLAKSGLQVGVGGAAIVLGEMNLGATKQPGAMIATAAKFGFDHLRRLGALLGCAGNQGVAIGML